VPVIYPVLLILLLVIAETTRDISVRTTNELIVYNTPGSSTIGIRTGRILNVYSDTSLMRQEVIRHSATFGLRIKTKILNNKVNCIRAGEKKILICDSPDQITIYNFRPDIVVITSIKPHFDKYLTFIRPPEAIVFSSGSLSSVPFPVKFTPAGTDTIHFVRKSGAFIKPI
jgi:hypothetical protein